MGLESGSFITDLVPTNPVGGTDPKGQGDDHLRLIKSVLKNSFPNITGAMTLTHLFLNGLLNRTIAAGAGLIGGGDLDVDRTIALGTPSSLTLATGNNVTGTTHTHSLAIPNAVSNGAAGLMSGADKLILDNLNAQTPVTLNGVQTLTNKTFTTGCSWNGTIGAITPNTGAFSSITVSGQIICSNFITALQNFISSTAAVVVAPTGAGTCYFRPNGAASASGQFYVDSTGNAVASASVFALSDERLKTNVENLDTQRALYALAGIRSVTYTKDAKEGVGFIAQNVQEFFPEVVTEGADTMLSVAYGNMVAILWEVVKHQQNQIDVLNARLGFMDNL